MSHRSGAASARSATTLGQLREAIRVYLAPRRHTVLLVALVAAFLVRPLIGDFGAGPPIFSLAMLVLLLLALYNINVDDLVGERETLLAQSRRRSIIAWTLAVPAFVERFAIFLAPSRSLYLSGSILWLLLFAYITWNELRAVLKQKEITREVISMSISVYLLFGLTFGLFYIVLQDIQPHAFSFSGAGPPSDQQLIHPGPHLLQPDYFIDDRVWRYHSDNSTGPLLGGR
jgi:hypothetical protein